ncbi:MULTISPECIES: 8-amino-7-oxononanoate synthase [unclassified Proteus (in: enterobacteria)]|uniref:8-amino-7-oxononanoate synthase n=1 Tax=unclassified Proteus (in: enterobacteria) TaxID=257482 RepID=UPI001377304C|nr:MULTISPECIES: 8-amino-7-oxononanoate synthase [unclassified Proteus (in: enterobacteria)]NBM94029.1 8-amino-7-oxononanoate synthase [Proteus sp. G2662]NBN26665.1 8-amino-7-oxononanoate synthase [Proteus sp. G2657]
MSWQTYLDEQLNGRRNTPLWRKRNVIKQVKGRFLITISGEKYLNFSGNDYLGISQHADVIKAWQQGADEYGVGSGGSGHITGFTQAHAQLEQHLADWLGYDNALLFSSGYSANQGVISALLEKDDAIIADKLCHASLMEAAVLSPAILWRFLHNSSDSLFQRLNKTSASKTLVVTEGVFSMDGDQAPLTEIATISRQHDAWLMVDDAHGIGVLGKEGRGSCDEAGIKPELLVVTFGKAFGVSGAAVLCNKSTAEFFEQYARHLIYSTSMPPAQAVALHSALNMIKQADGERAYLQQLIDTFRQGVVSLPIKLLPSQTAIQPLIIGDEQLCQTLPDYLQSKGLWVKAIFPPTVPPQSARLRITLTTRHHLSDIKLLIETLHAFFSQNR